MRPVMLTRVPFCSVLVKPLVGNADVIIGHNTWTAFESARTSARSAMRFSPHAL
jgi:hypothetical protein